MDRTPETAYWNGYDQGRTTCLTKGSAVAARWLATHQSDPGRDGYARALWDWEDANGIPHDPLTGAS